MLTQPRRQNIESMNTIYCEQHKCTISISGCVARQKRASFGIGWKRGYGPGKYGARQVPFDPMCQECQQGKEVMDMFDVQTKRPAKINDDGFPDKADFGEKKKSEPAWPELTEAEAFHEKPVTECFGRAPDTEKEKQNPESVEAIPYGHCHCGCGQKTVLAYVNDTKKGYKKGQPRKYIKGHHMRKKPHTEYARPKKQIVKKAGGKQPGPVRKNRPITTEKESPVERVYQENVSGRTLIIDFEALADAEKLRELLEKRAAENLRTVDAQATWEVVQAIRKIKNPAPVVYRSSERIPALCPGAIRLSDYPGAEIEIEEEMD